VSRVSSARLTPVLALAWTRAEKDKSYTKLGLMDEARVEQFFEQNKVDGELRRTDRQRAS
jgi:predicted SAM-dependent methyltransferase